MNNNNNNNNNKAFSLIELSIVPIIIGLLVAGITGGQSLIYNAKINGAMKEIQNFKQGIFAFKALKDRLPGDLKNNNQIGLNADQRYDDNTFGGDFVSSKCGYSAEEISEQSVEGAAWFLSVYNSI